MKTTFGCMTIVAFLAFWAHSTDTNMGVHKGLSVTVLEAPRSAKLRVALANSSKGPLRVWKDSNSWGAARWRVLILRNGKLQTFFQDPDQDFTVNLPTFSEIAAGSYLERRLDLNDGTWRSSEGERISLVPGDTAIFIYDVPFTQECPKLGVWYGVAASSTVID